MLIFALTFWINASSQLTDLEGSGLNDPSPYSSSPILPSPLPPSSGPSPDFPLVLTIFLTNDLFLFLPILFHLFPFF